MSALNCFEKFAAEKNVNLTWPISDKLACDFICWAVNDKQLKSSTVKAYLSAIKIYHEMRKMQFLAMGSPIVKAMLRGAANLELYKSIARPARKVMTLPLLKLLGHQVAKSGWAEADKQMLWSAFTLAFFGSFRFGEILAPKEFGFNEKEHLTWKDVSIRSDSVTVKIKIPKCRHLRGEIVELYELKGFSFCPVQALKKYFDVKGRHAPANGAVFQLCS